MNFVHAVAILFIHVHDVNAQQCRTKYTLSNVCRANYGQWLDDVTGLVTSFHCSALCAANTGCISFLFDAGRCQLNAEEATTFGQVCSTRVVYGLVEKATCRQYWLHEPCVSTCPVPNSRCQDNTCTCDIGYAYHRKSDSCVAECNVYGRSFTLQYSVLHGFDAAIFPGKTISECFDLCIAATGFVCRAVERIPDTGPQGCYLVAETALTQPASVNYVGPEYTYRRNCA